MVTNRPIQTEAQAASAPPAISGARIAAALKALGELGFADVCDAVFGAGQATPAASQDAPSPVSTGQTLATTIIATSSALLRAQEVALAGAADR